MESVAEDHHCRDHAHFSAGCEVCQRARAAFLPYKNVDPHPEPASRSFQTMLGPAFPPVIAIDKKDLIELAVVDGVVEGIVDVLLRR